MLLLIFQWHTGVYKETFNVNKIAKTKKQQQQKQKEKIKQNKMKWLKQCKILKCHCQRVKSTGNDKLWRLSGRFQALIWRLGDMVQNLESPGLTARVDSTAQFSAVATGPFLVPRLYMDANPDSSYTLE